jgi:hypothetical protein
VPVHGLLEGVVFAATDPDCKRRNEIRDNDFREAELVDVAFRHGIELDAQLLPAGKEYVRLRGLKRRIRRARREVKRWEDATAQADALVALEIMENVFRQEDDVFTKRDFLIGLADSEVNGSRVLKLVEASG